MSRFLRYLPIFALLLFTALSIAACYYVTIDKGNVPVLLDAAEHSDSL